MRTICIKSLDEMADHKDRWEALRKSCGGSIYTSYMLSKLWLRAFEDAIAPRVILIEEAGNIITIAPLALQQYTVAGLPIRSLSLVGDVKDRLGLSELRIMCEPGRMDAMKEAIRSLTKQKWNALRVDLMEECESNQYFFNHVQSSWACHEGPKAAVTKVQLPKTGGVDEIFGKKTKENIRRISRRLDRENETEFRAIPEAEIERSIDIYAEQHIKRWEAKGGSYFKNPKNVEYLKRAMKESYHNGSGHAHELLIDGQVAAQVYGFSEGDFAWYFRMGINDDFAKYSPGMILALKAWTDLRERGITTISLGYGDEAYKRNLGGQESPLLRLQAKRGMLSLLCRFADCSTFRQIDSFRRIKERAFGNIYR